jgi:hypothetical protein
MQRCKHKDDADDEYPNALEDAQRARLEVHHVLRVISVRKQGGTG